MQPVWPANILVGGMKVEQAVHQTVFLCGEKWSGNMTIWPPDFAIHTYYKKQPSMINNL